MDELNRNQNEHNENTQNDNATTPYQTPVRGASGAGSSYQSSTEQQQSYTYGQTAGQNSQTDSNSTSYQQAAGQQQTSSTHNNANAYEQWSGNAAPKKDKDKKPKKHWNSSKFPWKSVAAVVLVGAVAFGGGILYKDNANGGSSTPTAAVSSGSGDSANSSSTTMNLSETAASDDAVSYNGVYEKVSPSIVSVVVNYVQQGASGSGSGVIMSEDGYIVTNNHVVDGGDQYQVVMSDGTSYSAELVGTDEQTDLAVLKIDATGLTAAEFADSENVKVGDRVFAIGSPGGVEFQNSFTGGYISAINRDVTINDRVMSLLQTDTAINPGNSGGALINTSGQVIGITSSKLSSSSSSSASIEGMGFAIPTHTAKEVVDQLIANGYVTGRPAIGISGYDIDETRAQYFNIPQGVMITSIDTASDANNQDVKTGDIIVAVNGQEITGMTEINTIKNELSAGDSITLTLYRNGKKFDVTIKLVDQNDLAGSTSTDSETDSSQNNSQDSSGSQSYGYWNPFGGYGNYTTP